MKNTVVALFLLLVSITELFPQVLSVNDTAIKKVVCTSVKDQAQSGTCWSFSILSLIESQAIQAGLGEFDLSEMFTVRNTYVDKARNYVLRQGAAQFSSGGLGHDAINSITRYGLVPETVYSGLLNDVKVHNHEKLDNELKVYLDSVLKVKPVPLHWLTRFQQILDKHLGKAPETFNWNGKTYTPQSFSREVVRFNPDDYVFITSFTHHPFYRSFVLEIPDNYASEAYYNIPLAEMMEVINGTIDKGYSLMWDTDVSNANFRQKTGFALLWKDPSVVDPEGEEEVFNQNKRQELFETLVTQDDHLMHIVGVEKTKSGRKLFIAKNSWGETGPFKGYIKVSEAYIAINTITLVVPKIALNESLKNKLNLK